MYTLLLIITLNSPHGSSVTTSTQNFNGQYQSELCRDAERKIQLSRSFRINEMKNVLGKPDRPLVFIKTFCLKTK